jgi:hypothetical protein
MGASVSKKPKEDISELQTKTMVPELQTASGVNNPNEKKFAQNEPTVHFELEKPRIGPGAEANTGTSTPEISIPTATTVKVQAPAPNAKPTKLRIQADPPPSIASATRRGPVARVLNATPLQDPPRGQPFWPFALLLLAAGGYYYYHSHPGKGPTSATVRDPASIAMSPQPDTILNKDMPVKDSPKDIKALMTPVITNYGQDDMGTFVLKSDNDNFRVLVNGKDMPVISGKISLPVHKKFELRFVRHGYKEIKMMANVTKPETREIVLKFEKGSDPKE